MPAKNLVKLSSLANNISKEVEGDWIPYLAWPGVKFKVRSPEYQPFKKARDKLLREIAKARQQDGGELDEGEVNAKFGKLYAEHLLLGWEGLDTAYTPELAEQTLCDPAFRQVQQAVVECAALVGTQEIAFLEQDAKN